MANSGLLTTHFDIHHTLRDILELSVGRSASQSLPSTEYGQSLLERLENRTCVEAGGMSGYCSCSNGFLHVDSDHPDITVLAETIVTDINKYLADNQYEECMELSLEKLKQDDVKEVP